MNTEHHKIERVTLKLPSYIAEYFRNTFPHGRRSEFVAECILKYKREQEIKHIEEELKKVGHIRQK